MKTASIAATVSALLSIAIAQPHNHHARHNALHEKRDIVWETTLEIVWETVDVTTTITVTPGQVTSTVSSVVKATPVSSSASSAVQFIQPASSSSVAPVATSTLPAAPPVPTTSSVVAAAPLTTLVPVVAPPTSSPVVAVEPTTSVAEVAPAPVSTDAPATVCTSGSPCSGDITWYQTGLGSCGWTNATTDPIVALSHFLMGTESNNGEGGMNPYCGKTISIDFGGVTTTAVVVDTCEGCNYTSIDLSPAVFSNLDDLGAGRIQGTWHFED